MRELAPMGVEINFDGVDRRFLFNVNVIDELQEKFDLPIADIIKGAVGRNQKNHSVLVAVVVALVNEDVEIHNDESADKWNPVDEKYVRRRITIDNMFKVISAIIEAFSRSLPKRTDDDDDPQMSGR